MICGIVDDSELPRRPLRLMALARVILAGAAELPNRRSKRAAGSMESRGGPFATRGAATTRMAKSAYGTRLRTWLIAINALLREWRIYDEAMAAAKRKRGSDEREGRLEN